MSVRQTHASDDYRVGLKRFAVLRNIAAVTELLSFDYPIAAFK